ncbi:hypothetical protein OR16_15827 [Cupriavidus basilensis OR16]|uniref:Acetaldehyde dehydrogenase n=1 Tax=Cupriavidus basilensis OR16 TaxID=1127483 RepID=H1S5M8_9BURK|nr:hypothetical protein OR16_15827 [Cupriavidus basilensis OR16]
MPNTESPDAVQRVVATPAALALIERLRAQHGALMFHQSGGCCDGSAPMCYPDGELRARSSSTGSTRGW